MSKTTRARDITKLLTDLAAGLDRTEAMAQELARSVGATSAELRQLREATTELAPTRAWAQVGVFNDMSNGNREPVPPVAFKPESLEDITTRLAAFRSLYGYRARLVVTGTWETAEGQRVDMGQAPATVTGGQLAALPYGSNGTGALTLALVDLAGQGSEAQRVEIHAIPLDHLDG